MRILAIETSCDETAASIVEECGGALEVHAHTVSSQAELHAQYGGVVPNLAAREHVKSIIPVLEKTLTEAKLSSTDIDAIAVTRGPGLIPALLIGTTAAKTLALAWNLPLLGVNHLEGHIYANLLSPETKLRFPLLALLVSGGHTELVLMRGHFQYEILGETEDDAAGEAFDKVAKMLGLPYPGGPIVAKRADEFRNSQLQVSDDKFEVKFPRPMLDAENYQFSFSGLKTSVLYFLKKHESDLKNEEFKDAVCHEFQEAVVDVLVGKTERALIEFSPKTVVIAGGVSANVRLRDRMEKLITEKFPETQFLMPEFKYSLDNASMIGAAAAMRLAHLHPSELESLKSNALTLEPSASLSLV